jgi:hypothetical protein
MNMRPLGYPNVSHQQGARVHLDFPETAMMNYMDVDFAYFLGMVIARHSYREFRRTLQSTFHDLQFASISLLTRKHLG